MPSQPQSGQATPGRSKTTFPTPDSRDTIFQDVLLRNLGDYSALLTGAQHTQWDQNPEHVLLREIPIDWQTVARVYAKDRMAEQTYNGGVTYLNESKDHPVYTRDFLIRRSDYNNNSAQNKMLTHMSGLVRAAITDRGGGYTQQTVSVAFSGGVGSGAAATAIVSNDPVGSVLGVQITACGSYTIPPRMTISDSGVGNGAVGAVYLQPKPAVLVREQILRMPDDPLDALYVLIRRTYMTLPGPWVPDSDYDPQRGRIQIRRRAVANSGQHASDSATSRITYEAMDSSAFVSFEIERTNTDGTGSEGNPPFPITDTDFYDKDRGAVQQRAQTVVRTGSETGTLDVSGGLVTEIRYEPINEFLLRKITETWSIPGPVLRNEDRYDESRGKITGTRRLVANTSQAQGESASGSTRYGQSGYGNSVLWQTTESWNTSAFPISRSSVKDRQRGAVLRTSQLAVATNPVQQGSVTVASGSAHEVRFEEVNEFLLRRVEEVWAIPTNPVVTLEREPETGAIVKNYEQLVSIADVPAALQPGNGYNGGIVLVRGTSLTPQDEGSVIGLLRTRTITDPLGLTLNYIDEQAGIYPLPDVFTFIVGWAVPRADGCAIGGPFLGENYTLVRRVPSRIFFRFLTFTTGRDPASVPLIYSVTSHQSRFLPIDANTIHGQGANPTPNGFTYVLKEEGVGCNQVVERMPVSSPSTYTPDSLLTVGFKQEPWAGFEPLWKRVKTVVIAT